jgi:hypothetical protein
LAALAEQPPAEADLVEGEAPLEALLLRLAKKLIGPRHQSLPRKRQLPV